MCVCAEKLDVCFFVLLVFLYLNYTTARVHDTGAERRWLLAVCVFVHMHAYVQVCLYLSLCSRVDPVTFFFFFVSQPSV